MGKDSLKGKSPVPFGYLLMTNVSPLEWCVPIDATRKVIGRGKDADVRVSGSFPSVSRRHAAVRTRKEQMVIQDLGSTAGTSINGVWIERSREVNVARGDRISLGQLELHVVSEVPTLVSVVAERGGAIDSASEKTSDHAGAVRDHRLLTSLTQAELEILLWIGRGYVDDKELGKILHRSPNTVRTHVSSILQKLELHSRAEVVAWLRRNR